MGQDLGARPGVLQETLHSRVSRAGGSLAYLVHNYSIAESVRLLAHPALGQAAELVAFYLGLAVLAELK